MTDWGSTEVIKSRRNVREEIKARSIVIDELKGITDRPRDRHFVRADAMAAVVKVTFK